MNRTVWWRNKCIGLSLILLSGIYLVVAYWMFAPYKVVQVNNIPIPLLNEGGKVKAGDMARFHIVSDKYMEIPALVTRQLIDGCNIPIYSGHSNLPTGTIDHVIRVWIPDHVPTGMYKMRSTYKFQVNPIRTIVYTHDSTDFEVVGRVAK